MSDDNSMLEESNQTLIANLEQAFPGIVLETIGFLGEITIVVDRTAVVSVCRLLRDGPGLAFNVMCDLSAVDMWPTHPRFEVNVHLLALKLRPQPGEGTRRLRVKVRLEEHDAVMPTLSDVWSSAAWYERETHELFGIDFDGNADLRPLLLPEDWSGTPPLRRDVPVYVEEVAFSFNQERIYRQKPFAKD